MKKTLLLSAVAIAAISANAEVIEYDFVTNPPICARLMDVEDELYAGGGNYEFLGQYGNVMPNVDGIMGLSYTPDSPEVAVPVEGICISMLDGGIYKLDESVVLPEYFEDFELYEVLPEENKAYPVLSWGANGFNRVLFMPGWDNTAGYEADKDYGAASEADWVSTKNGMQFNRLGTMGMLGVKDTYIQLPPMTGKITLTVYAGTQKGKFSSDQDLNVLVTPVVDGVVDEDNAQTLFKEFASLTYKRMYKLGPIDFDATGKSVALRIGTNGNHLDLQHIILEGTMAEAGVEGIISDAADVNAPVYNTMGVKVDDSYKGIVIKNGKKYVQK